jgi:hypothetical protein
MTADTENRRGWLFSLKDDPDSDWGSVDSFYESMLEDLDGDSEGEFESDVWGKVLDADSRLQPGDGIAFYHSSRARFPMRDKHRRRPRISLIAELLEVDQEGREVGRIAYRVVRSTLDRFEDSPIVWTSQTDHIFRATGLGAGPIATFYPLSPTSWAEIESIAGVSLASADDAIVEHAPRVGASVSKPPARVEYKTVRIVRDTKTARTLKAEYDHECQICSETIFLRNGERYSEAHHIRPLGREHNGPDIRENLMVLCPNHHAVLDLGAARFESPTSVRVGEKVVDLVLKHDIAQSSLDYHNEHLAGATGRAYI